MIFDWQSNFSDEVYGKFDNIEEELADIKGELNNIKKEFSLYKKTLSKKSNKKDADMLERRIASLEIRMIKLEKTKV